MFVPMILFVLFVMPLWLILHYRDKARREKAAEQPTAIAADPATPHLADLAARMERRIAALESVLDAESPGWRSRHGHE